MTTFESKKLVDIAELIIDYRGKTPKKLGGDWSEVLDGVPALSAKNIKGGQIVSQDSIRKVDLEMYKKWMKEEVKKGDILLTSEAPMGESYFWNTDDKIVLSQRLFAIRANKDLCVPRFLYFYIQSPLFQSELYKRASGSTASGIKQTQLVDTEILLPSLDIQGDIVDILSSLDDQIELNRKMNEVLEEMGQMLFRHWFVEFEFPWDFKKNEFSWDGKPYKSSGGEMVESELGEIPKEWEVKKCLDICDFIKSGSTPRRNNPAFWLDGKIPWVKSGELRDNILIDTAESINREGLDGSSCKLIPEMSVLIAIYAAPTVGQLAINGIPVTTNQAITSLVPSKEIGPGYIYYSLKQYRGYFNNISAGAAQQNISKDIVENTKVAVGSELLMKSFSSSINEFLVLRKVLVEEIDNLTQTRDLLLPRLMSGKLRVPVEK